MLSKYEKSWAVGGEGEDPIRDIVGGVGLSSNCRDVEHRGRKYGQPGQGVTTPPQFNILPLISADRHRIRLLNPLLPANLQTVQHSRSSQSVPRSNQIINTVIPMVVTKPCGFCRGNGECAEVYSSHQLRSPGGQVTCPWLREHVCETCGATGDQAHTRSYCPLTPGARALPTLLKSTQRMASGRLRRGRRMGEC